MAKSSIHEYDPSAVISSRLTSFGRFLCIPPQKVSAVRCQYTQARPFEMSFNGFTWEIVEGEEEIILNMRSLQTSLGHSNGILFGNLNLKKNTLFTEIYGVFYTFNIL